MFWRFFFFFYTLCISDFHTPRPSYLSSVAMNFPVHNQSTSGPQEEAAVRMFTQNFEVVSETKATAETSIRARRMRSLKIDSLVEDFVSEATRKSYVIGKMHYISEVTEKMAYLNAYAKRLDSFERHAVDCKSASVERLKRMDERITLSQRILMGDEVRDQLDSWEDGYIDLCPIEQVVEEIIWSHKELWNDLCETIIDWINKYNKHLRQCEITRK